MAEQLQPRPSLAALIEQSKDALQKGQELGSIGDELSRNSTALSFEVQIIDARLRWLTNGVIDQLKLAASIATSLAQRQATIQMDIKQWDATRDQRSRNLDHVLDKLATQFVPPEFHQTAIDEADAIFKNIDEDTTGMESDRSIGQGAAACKWRTLRDFVDEKGILDASEAIDEDRLLIDDLLATRADNPAALEEQISGLREAMKPTLQEVDIASLMIQRDEGIHEIANRVESLATHYDQLEDAQQAVEANEAIHLEDFEVFIRDTRELPTIIAELEDYLSRIKMVEDALIDHKQKVSALIAKYPESLKLLDHLSTTMTSMIHQQDQLETEISEFRFKLQSHLETLDELCATYESYQLSFNILVLEMNRRSKWSEEIINEVNKMKAILTEYRDIEARRRESFMTTYGSSLPEDLCHSIANVPTLFDIIPVSAEDLSRNRALPAPELFPAIPEALLTEARSRVGRDA